MSNKSKFAIIVPELLPVPPSEGGAIEYWVHEVSRHLTKSFDITIFSRPSHQQGYDGVQYCGIPWTKTAIFFLHLKNYFSWRNPLRAMAKIQNVASYGLELYSKVRGFDVVAIHNEPNLLWFISAKHNRNIVLHMHNDHLTSHTLKFIYDFLLNKVEKVICVSEYIRNRAVQHFPDHADKFIVIYNATDAEAFKPDRADARARLASTISFSKHLTYLLYVGRLTENKGAHILIEAFASLFLTNPDLRLIISGSSFFADAKQTPYQKKLITLANPIKDAVIFTGFLPHSTLKDLYTAADIVVVPSVWQDPCPLVVLEAMSSEACLVASRVGGIPEVVEHMHNGLLVEPANTEALANELQYIILHPERKRCMQQAAREKILKGYTWSQLAEKVETNIRRVIELEKFGKRVGGRL